MFNHVDAYARLPPETRKEAAFPLKCSPSYTRLGEAGLTLEFHQSSQLTDIRNKAYAIYQVKLRSVNGRQLWAGYSGGSIP
jgi:hypothetical protein